MYFRSPQVRFSSVSACRGSKVSIRAHTSDPPSPHVSYHSFARERELTPQKHPAACAPPELLTTPVCVRDFLHCLRKTESHGSTKQADQQPTCNPSFHLPDRRNMQTKCEASVEQAPTGPLETRKSSPSRRVRRSTWSFGNKNQ